eukprot:CAMPEP_0117756188 /NCGR_PEP_ID=MMETSP0947-20121206/13910_1 /TAXON_ID=44440 /ORGANISM="Chattonella subsalsa, Strain CCMP2191" /LENGTH=158 /DNA_ID=CAMNT_0005575689 /DNA_START=178 /DNA_END=655 /DNA_ORIENTATION=+
MHIFVPSVIFKELYWAKLNPSALSAGPNKAPYYLTKLAAIRVTTPTPDEAAEMGAREWPQNVKQGEWKEQLEVGKIRYILDGTGEVEVLGTEDDKILYAVGPGTLVEVIEEQGCELKWSVDGSKEMVILTPGYEDGKALAGAAFLLLLGLMGLIFASN